MIVLNENEVQVELAVGQFKVMVCSAAEHLQRNKWVILHPTLVDTCVNNDTCTIADTYVDNDTCVLQKLMYLLKPAIADSCDVIKMDEGSLYS